MRPIVFRVSRSTTCTARYQVLDLNETLSSLPVPDAVLKIGWNAFASSLPAEATPRRAPMWSVYPAFFAPHMAASPSVV